LVSGKHKKKARSANKIGRNGRPKAHRLNGLCGRKSCPRLRDSRKYDSELGAYVPR